MGMIAAIFWYLVVFEPAGGLMTLPTPHGTAQACQAAMDEFREVSHPSTWDFQCVGPGDEWGAD